jgi:hypothetical protein
MDWRRIIGNLGEAVDAGRYLDDLSKAQRYDDAVRQLDEFYGRTPAPPAMVPEAPRPLTTAEQMAAAGIPMPSYARSLASAADAAGEVGLGPGNAALRNWLDARPADPVANPRGAASTALDAIAASWDETLAGPQRVALERIQAARQSALARRQAVMEAARKAARTAAPHALPALAATLTGAGAGVAINNAAQQRRPGPPAPMEGAPVGDVPDDWGLTDEPGYPFTPVEMGEGPAVEPEVYIESPEEAAILEGLVQSSRPLGKSEMPASQFHQIMGAFGGDEEQLPLSEDAFSAADLVEETRPRPRLPGNYPSTRLPPRRGY